MKENVVTYGSLHAYLDEVLGKMDNPSVEHIKQAKRAYWKLYFRNYRKEQRKARKEFTLSFEKNTLERIDKQRGKLTVSKFLYFALEQTLGSGKTEPPLNREVLNNIHHLLALIVSLLEELLDREQHALTKEVLKHIEQLEEMFVTLRKNKQV